MSIKELFEKYTESKCALAEALVIPSWVNVADQRDSYWCLAENKNYVHWGTEKDYIEEYGEEIRSYEEKEGYALVYAHLSTGEEEYMLFDLDKRGEIEED